MKKLLVTALMAAATLGFVAVTPSTAEAQDGWRWRDRDGRRWDRGDRWDRRRDWLRDNWRYGRNWPTYYRYVSPYRYSYGPTYYYSPYGYYYNYPRSGLYFNLRF